MNRQLDLYSLIQATYHPAPAIPTRGGIHPVKACLDRLLWFQRDRLSDLLAGVSNKPEMQHYEAAVRENPARIEAMRRDLLGAITYELQAHGCVLLPKARIQ